MNNDRSDRTRGGSRGMSETDKGYYEDLYTDLPKEVVDILMQTHPLMGKTEDEEASAYRSRNRGSRRPQREDVEEVREARMQQVGNEINEISRAPQQEGDPTRYVSRRARNAAADAEESYASYQTAAPRAAVVQDDDYDDGIQYVSVVPARKKSKIVEEITLQTTAAPTSSRRRRPKEPQPFEDMGRERDNRPRYESIDFEERAKQEHLDSLYDYDYGDDDEFSGKGKLAIVLGVVAVILIIFLIFRTVSLNSQVEEMQNQVTQSEEYKVKYEQAQLENMKLEEELENLKNPPADAAAEGEGVTGEGAENNGGTAAANPAGATSGNYTEYTVQSGDTAWTIAQKTLGNGAEYQKILDANGLKESDPLKIGSKIKIPK